MANITRIKASGSKKDSSGSKDEERAKDDSDKVVARVKSKDSAKATKVATKKAERSAEKADKEARKAIEKKEMAIAKQKAKGEAESTKKKRKVPAILKPLYWIFTPVRLLWRYIRESFAELRQVRWPNRKETWKLTVTVIGYVVAVAVAIMLLDALLTFVFNKILGGQ